MGKRVAAGEFNRTREAVQPLPKVGERIGLGGAPHWGRIVSQP